MLGSVCEIYSSSFVTRTILGAEVVRVTRASGPPRGKLRGTGNIEKRTLTAAVELLQTEILYPTVYDDDDDDGDNNNNNNNTIIIYLLTYSMVQSPS